MKTHYFHNAFVNGKQPIQCMGFRMAAVNTLYIYETSAYVKNTLFNTAILTLYTLNNYGTFGMLLNSSLLCNPKNWENPNPSFKGCPAFIKTPALSRSFILKPLRTNYYYQPW